MIENKIEHRFYDDHELRIAKGDDESRSLVGYAAMFDKLSDDLGGFREKIAPGAFAKSIGKADVRALWNHDSNYVLGRTKSGTLELEEDDRGLKIKVDPPDTQWCKDLMTSIERGDVSQMSFGFRCLKDSWDTNDKRNIRTLDEVELIDVSPVTFPAYKQTKVALRNLFESVGMDFDDLSHILVRSEKGLAITDDDVEIIKDTIEKLDKILPEVDATVTKEVHTDKHEDKQPTQHIQMLRKRLELKLKERELNE